MIAEAPNTDVTEIGASLWRFPIAGVRISATTYAQATAAIVDAAKARRPTLVAATSVHGVTIAASDHEFRNQLNAFDMLTPDGQPLRWGLNLLYGVRLRDRVYGPTLMLHVCEEAAHPQLRVYFYGSTALVLERLSTHLQERIPGLQIAGHRAPPFRQLSPEEDADDVRDILDSRTDILFVALGCPRQEQWAYRHRSVLPMPIVCVGAAFEFHAGTLRQAPPWMQRQGLEWAFRLAVEPRRLWRRYLRAVPLFLFLLGRQYIQHLGGNHAVRRTNKPGTPSFEQ